MMFGGGFAGPPKWSGIWSAEPFWLLIAAITYAVIAKVSR